MASAVASTLGQLGDLGESALKRRFQTRSLMTTTRLAGRSSAAVNGRPSCGCTPTTEKNRPLEGAWLQGGGWSATLNSGWVVQPDARPGSFTVVSGPPTEHVHMAFPATDDAIVDAFHSALIEAGYRDNGAPGERAVYHPGYYGAYVLDPDGNNVELVNHNR